MIEWFHRVSKSFIATLLMAGLALSFVVWGVADVFVGQSSNAVATVGGHEIDQTTFTRTYRNLVRNEGQRLGMDLSPEMAQKMGLGQTVLQQMMTRLALDNYAAKLGLATSDAQVAEQVRAIPAFRGPNGQFDHNVFLQTIQASGYNSENAFLDEVRDDSTRTQLSSAVESFFGLPPEYSLALYLYINEKRAADYVVVPAEAAGAIAPPDDKILTAFIKDNAPHFSTPEYRDVQYAWASPADVPVTVTDKMIADEFAARQATYNIPEKRELYQLEFKDEAEARAARAKLDSGTTFEQLAATKGLKPADTSLGAKTQAELGDPAVATAAFAVKEGETSQPVKGTFGWVMVKTGKITVPGQHHTLDEVKDQVRAGLQTQLAADKLVDMLNAYDDARKQGEDMAAAAKKAGLKIGHAAAIDAQGNTPEGAKADVPADADFLTLAFKAEVGQDNDPVQAKSGAYYVVKVLGVTPPKLKPLDQVRDEAVKQWTAQERSKLLTAKAQALTAQAEKDKSLTGVAAALKVSVQKSAALSRNSNDETLPGALVQKLFDAQQGGIVSAPRGDVYVIAQVTGIAHPRPGQNDAQFRSHAQQLAGGVAGDFTLTMANAERAAQRTTVNQKLLDSATGSGS
ncbi:MAG: SurA N-terminal domain-containing protein [Alphaproteobacteria bacterium]|nr:SurA N-terminal domain-containing protein [Alphaproteobacteria bacterium]